MRRRLLAHALAAVALFALTPPNARSGGFEVGENGTKGVARGGAFTVLADDPTAIAINLQHFGMLVSLTVVIALLIDLAFTPALLRTFFKSQP